MKQVLSIKKQVLRMKRTGFTLIELLVVISIIGLLAGLVISNVAGVRERARDVERKTDLDQIKKALRMYTMTIILIPQQFPLLVMNLPVVALLSI